MKDITSQLEHAISTLAAEGKTPTVALIKARLTAPAPMPAIITALKAWKAGNKVPKIEVTAAPKDHEQRIEELEQQVKALTERLAVLEQQQGAQ